MTRAAVLLALTAWGVATMVSSQDARVDGLGDPLPLGAVQRLGTLRMRYPSVGGLAYLPDGRGVVLCGGNLDIWDLGQGLRQSSTKVSEAALVSLHLRADGRMLLLGDAAGRVHEWDPARRATVRAWDTGQQALRSAVYSPDGRRMLVAGESPLGAQEWDLEHGRPLTTLRSEMVSLRAGAIYGADGRTAILGGGYEHNLEHHDLATGRLLRKWCSVYESKCVALSPNGRYVTVGLEDRATEWSLADYTRLHDYKHRPGEAARVFSVVYLPATDEVLCGGRDGSINRWNRKTGERVFSWQPHQGTVALLAASPDDKWALSYGSGLVAETSVTTGEPRIRWDRHMGSVEAAAFTPSGDRVVSGSSDQTLRVWDVATGRTARILTGALLGAYAVDVSPDGRRVVAGCKDGRVREYSLSDGRLQRELKGHLGYVRAVAYAPDGARIVSAADDGSIRVWGGDPAGPLVALRGHRGGVLALALSPDGERLVSGGRDGTVRCWDMETGRLARTIPAARSWVTCVALTRNGRWALSAGADGVVRKWSTRTGKLALEMGEGHGAYTALACTPDGRQVVAAAGDRVLCFDLRTGALLQTWSGHQGPVLSVALSRDGRRVVSGSQDTTLLVWERRPVRLPAARATRPAAPARLAVAGAFHEAHESFGCEANPTGDPIGGGPGYRDIKKGGDFTVRTVAELLSALKSARAGQVIFVPDGVELDLTGHRALVVTTGVTLAGTRGANGSPGPRLFTSLRATSPLLRTGGYDVRVTGLRIEGPYAGPELIADFAIGLSLEHDGAEVDNCEVYNWNCVGIAAGGRGTVRVHHNSVHHCQLSGYGYGVATSECNCFIIANKLDWCRHDIASSGSPGDSYEAAWNLVGPNATSHRFDMHGGSDRGDGTEIAGDWVHIHHNTFLDAKRHAVVIRGVPSQGAEVHHNWFAQRPGEAIVSSGNTRVYRNAWGPEKARVE